MNEDYNDFEENYLPDCSAREYLYSPVRDQPLFQQVDYWIKRARFFEARAYRLINEIEELRERDDRSNEGEEWKNCDD